MTGLYERVITWEDHKGKCPLAAQIDTSCYATRRPMYPTILLLLHSIYHIQYIPLLSTYFNETTIVTHWSIKYRWMWHRSFNVVWDYRNRTRKCETEHFYKRDLFFYQHTLIGEQARTMKAGVEQRQWDVQMSSSIKNVRNMPRSKRFTNTQANGDLHIPRNRRFLHSLSGTCTHIFTRALRPAPLGEARGMLFQMPR